MPQAQDAKQFTQSHTDRGTGGGTSYTASSGTRFKVGRVRAQTYNHGQGCKPCHQREHVQPVEVSLSDLLSGGLLK